MTSERRRQANRRNAAKSTGPRTRYGKARSRHNAFRHGLSAEEIDEAEEATKRLAFVVHGDASSVFLLEQARRFAESQMLLKRVRTCRFHAVERLLGGDPTAGLPSDVRAAAIDVLNTLLSLDRYERRALSRRRRAMSILHALQ